MYVCEDRNILLFFLLQWNSGLIHKLILQWWEQWSILVYLHFRKGFYDSHEFNAGEALTQKWAQQLYRCSCIQKTVNVIGFYRFNVKIIK